METKLTLMHFDDIADLLQGIEMLQHHSIPICEVYTQGCKPLIETKLRIKSIRLGYAVLKFGCLGGIAITTFACYILEHGLTQPGEKSVFDLLLTALIILATFFLGARLFPGRVPKVIDLSSNGNKYLIVVNAKNITPNETIASLLKYAEAVEISTAIKNIVIS